jgi:hypothetical protein
VGILKVGRSEFPLWFGSDMVGVPLEGIEIQLTRHVELLSQTLMDIVSVGHRIEGWVYRVDASLTT